MVEFSPILIILKSDIEWILFGCLSFKKWYLCFFSFQDSVATGDAFATKPGT
jgi:hypothetical protein